VVTRRIPTFLLYSAMYVGEWKGKRWRHMMERGRETHPTNAVPNSFKPVSGLVFNRTRRLQGQHILESCYFHHSVFRIIDALLPSITSIPEQQKLVRKPTELSYLTHKYAECRINNELLHFLFSNLSQALLWPMLQQRTKNSVIAVDPEPFQSNSHHHKSLQ
jgi:hypothetical protein